MARHSPTFAIPASAFPTLRCKCPSNEMSSKYSFIHAPDMMHITMQIMPDTISDSSGLDPRRDHASVETPVVAGSGCARQFGIALKAICADLKLGISAAGGAPVRWLSHHAVRVEQGRCKPSARYTVSTKLRCDSAFRQETSSRPGPKSACLCPVG